MLKETYMRFIVDLLKGIFIGAANIIPGVSGGTMAVSMGIYDKLMEAIGNLAGHFKKSFKTLLPIIIGMVIGILGFSLLVPHLLSNYPFQTCMCFAGLVIGGIPELVGKTAAALKKEKRSNIGPFHVIFFIIFVALSIFMALSNPSGADLHDLTMNFKNFCLLFGIGAVAAAAMVVPGISGSLILMMLGYYESILEAIGNLISGLKSFNWTLIGQNMLILLPFALGCIVGIILIAKLITLLLKKFASVSYCAIIGLVITSPFAIFFKMDKPAFTPLVIIIGIVLFIAGLFFTYVLSVKTKGKAETENTSSDAPKKRKR